MNDLYSHIAPEPIEAPLPAPLKVVRGRYSSCQSACDALAQAARRLADDLIEHRARIAAYRSLEDLGDAAPDWGTVCGIIEAYNDSVREQHGDRQFAREQQREDK
jgi:hypothetical protein